MEATLFGITLPSTCWELGVKRFTYSAPILTSPSWAARSLAGGTARARGLRLF